MSFRLTTSQINYGMTIKHAITSFITVGLKLCLWKGIDSVVVGDRQTSEKYKGALFTYRP